MDLPGGAFLLVKAEDILDAAEVSQDPEVRFALFAERLDDAIVAEPMGLVRLKRRHVLRIYDASKIVKFNVDYIRSFIDYLESFSVARTGH